MKIKVAQIVGLNTDQKAALTSYQQREDETFLAALQLSSDDAFTKGRLTLSELSDFYFDSEGTASEKLNNTFLGALKKFEDQDSFNLVLGSISGKVLYLIGKGDVDVYLKRSDKLSPLLSLGSSAQIISGFLQPGDHILLCTKSLTSFLGDDISKSLSLSPDSFEEEVSSSEEKECLAGLAIEVESEEDKAIPSLPDEEEEYEAVPQNKDTKLAVFKTIFNQGKIIISKAGHYFPKSGRGRLILALSLVVIVAAGAGLQYKSSRDKERKMQFNQNLQSAKDEFAAAKGLSSLNPQEAKGKLEGAKAKVNLALSLDSKNKEASDLKKQIEDESSSILQQFEASQFPIYLDLDLIKKDFKAQNLTLSAGKILLLDPDTKTLVSLDLSKKSHQILSGKDKLGDAKYASINGSLAFVYSQDKGIVRVDIENQKASQVSQKDSDWNKIQDITGFASNVYLLDTGNPSTHSTGSGQASSGQIWKYLPTSSGYSDKREYLNQNTKADLSDSLRMQIESSIYVLKKGGEMMRFTRGAKDHFSYGGLDQGIKDPKSFFVSSDTDNLYLLDSGNSRLLILTKIGEYKGQITGSKFATASDLVVDEKSKKVYLLEGSKVYTVDLK